MAKKPLNPFERALRSALRLLGGDAFASHDFHVKTLLKCFFVQKILRVNWRVPWPVHWSSVVKSPQHIDRGNRCPGLSMGCYLDGRNGIVIGDNTWIGPRVSIISMNHSMTDYRQYVVTDPIVIGRNCWLGAGTIILPGTVLGEHVVVAAGSVVTKSFAENDILIGGVPAKIIKKIEPYQPDATS